MRSSLVRRTLVVGSLVLGVACAPSQAPDDSEASSSTIINGAADTAHDAVVALFTSNSLCTGTIIKKDVDKKVAWVATAAHCVTPSAPVRAVLAKDYAAPGAKKFGVIDSFAHPTYTGTGGGIPRDDFAIVRIAGIDESTPVISLATGTDGLEVGQDVISVGYGKTDANPTSTAQNSVRNVVTKKIEELDNDFIVYKQDQSGICSGDSGGPVLAGTGADKRLVGIHSFVAPTEAGAPPCAGWGVSGRVTTEAAFFEGELAKPVPAPDSCEFCGATAEVAPNGACDEAVRRCQRDSHCMALNQCLVQGGSVDQCLQQHPLGEAALRAYAICSCTQVRNVCPAACGTTGRCEGVPKCGFGVADATCGSCMEGSCCKEMNDCSVDGQCFACIKGNDADPKCKDNPARQALAACTASKCKSECVPEIKPNDEGDDKGDGKGDGTKPNDTSTNPTTPDLPGGGLSPVTPKPEVITIYEDGGCSTTGTGTSRAGAGFFALALAATVAAARRRRSA